MKVEVAVLVSPSQIVTTVSVDLKQHRTGIIVKIEVAVLVVQAVLVSPSQIVTTVSVDVNEH